MTLRLAARRIVTPDAVVDGWIEIDDGAITAVHAGAAPTDARRTAGVIVPGFVDIHVHGGGGHSMTLGDPDDVVAAAGFHLGHGTTTIMASTVTAPLDELIATCERIAELIDSRAAAGATAGARLAGIHLEGPFLAIGRCGAQNPAHMIDPTPAAVDALITAGRGHLRMVTIAPERPGAIDAVRRFVAAGVLVAVGHTDADLTQARAAIDAGATVATHLANAMPPLLHRAPGPIGACLTDHRVTCELIVDNFHLDPTMVALAHAAKGAGGLSLITDAISAAGAGDGDYVLGGLPVRVSDGAARLVDGGSLAGSTLTMDAALRNTVAAGIPLHDAVMAAATNPARLLGLGDVTGSITAGCQADLVLLDRDLAVSAVLVAGEVRAGDLGPVTPPHG